MKKFYFDLQMFKGKGGSTTTYTMSPEERQLLVKQMGYLDEIYPNMIQLNKRAGDILWNSFADTQYDFNTANKNAQQQISNAQQGLGNLTQGQLPQAYTDNMTQAIQSGVQNSVGNLLNTMGNNGVINSSVTNQGMNDISKNVANTMANQFTNNVQTLGGLYNDQISNAGQGITTAAGAQDAAINIPKQMWQLSLGLDSANSGTLGSIAGKYGTTTVKNNSGGLGSFLGGAATGLAGNSGFWNYLGGGKK
jgi:hypothetical protein